MWLAMGDVKEEETALGDGLNIKYWEGGVEDGSGPWLI